MTQNTRDHTLRVTVTDNHGEIFECENEEEMVSYMAKSNLSRQQHSIETPFMSSPLVDIFRYLAEDKVAQAVINGTFISTVNTPKYVLDFLDTLVILDTITELGPVDLETSYKKNRMGRKKS